MKSSLLVEDESTLLVELICFIWFVGSFDLYIVFECAFIFYIMTLLSLELLLESQLAFGNDSVKWIFCCFWRLWCYNTTFLNLEGKLNVNIGFCLWESSLKFVLANVEINSSWLRNCIRSGRSCSSVSLFLLFLFLFFSCSRLLYRLFLLFFSCWFDRFSRLCRLCWCCLRLSSFGFSFLLSIRSILLGLHFFSTFSISNIFKEFFFHVSQQLSLSCHFLFLGLHIRLLLDWFLKLSLSLRNF